MQEVRIAVPPGIGDICWSLTKISNITQNAHIFIQNSLPLRGKEFTQRFTFVKSVSYADDFKIYPHKKWLQNISPSGNIYYSESGKGLQNYDYVLIANPHLEKGNRLESWLPEIETDFGIGGKWLFNEEDLEFARQIRDSRQYVVFHLGSEKNNTISGFNRGTLWTIGNWVALAKLVSEYCDIVVVGAKYDKSYSNSFIKAAKSQNLPVRDMVGKTSIGLTFSIIANANACFSYVCGIPIFASYLGTPVGHWWRRYGDSLSPQKFLSINESMIGSWVPPWVLEKGKYFAEIYGSSTPDSFFGKGKEWLMHSEKREFKQFESGFLLDLKPTVNLGTRA